MITRNKAVRQIYNNYPRTLSDLIGNRSAYGLDFKEIDPKKYDSADATGVPAERTKAVFRDYSVAYSVLGTVKSRIDKSISDAKAEAEAKAKAEAEAKAKVKTEEK